MLLGDYRILNARVGSIFYLTAAHLCKGSFHIVAQIGNTESNMVRPKEQLEARSAVIMYSRSRLFLV